MTSDLALLLVLRHFCYVGRHVSDQCFGTPVSATTILLRGQVLRPYDIYKFTTLPPNDYKHRLTKIPGNTKTC